MKRIDEAVGGVAGDDIDLLLNECAIEKAEIEDRGLSGEMEIVGFCEAGETVGTFEKFVADASAPFGRDGCDVGKFVEVKALGVVAANDHGKRVFKTERFGDFEMETLGVLLLHAAIDGLGGVAGRRFVEDGGERGTGVFDVEIKGAGGEGIVDQERW